MRRRTVLAAAPALLAGCFGTTDDPGDGSTTTTTRTTTDTTTTTATSTTTTDQPYSLVPADPESMTADEVEARLADRDCGSLADLPTTCPGDDARLGVSVSPTVGNFAGGAVEFTVENGADEAFMTNHYNWVLRKWDGSRWRRIAPLAIPGSLDSLPPGESHTHRIEPVESKVARSQHDYMMESDVALGGLGPGVYGFSTRGYFESTPDDERVAAAVLGFAGEAPPVRPTDDVTRLERDGSELVVHADAPEDRRAELVVSLGGEPDANLLPEHVRQLAALRNTLSYAATDGVETIRYVGHDGDVGMVDSYLPAVTPDDASRYGFRDYAFEVSVEGT